LPLLEESALKVLEIERKFAALSQKEKADIAKSDRDLQINQSNDTFDSIENALKISLSKKEILQSEYDARLRQLNIDRLDKELEIELQYQGLRQAQDALTFANNEAALKKQLDGRQISQEEYNKQLIELQKQFYSTQGQTEIDTQAGVNATLAELNQAKVDNQILTNDQLIAEDQRIKEAKSQLADLEKELLIQSLRNTAALIGESAKGNQAFGAFLKTLAIGEVIINLQSEISNNKKFAAVDPLNAVPGGEAIVRAKLIAKNLAATIGAGVSIAKISTQKFEEGGYSVPDMVRQYNPTFTDRPQGYVNRPTAWLNLAGEKEGEWIASGKLLRDPRTAPVIQSLEHYQRTGQRSVVRPFAGGGFTSPIIIPQGAGINATDIAAAVRAAVSDLQITPVVSVQEIVDVNQNMNNVRKVATL
jgi:hypothetical protein